MTVDERSSFELAAGGQPKDVAYNPALPIEAFDFIVTDEKRIRQARACCPLLLMDLMIRRIAPSSTWPSRLRALVSGFPRETGMSIEQMGFTIGWPK